MIRGQRFLLLGGAVLALVATVTAPVPALAQAAKAGGVLTLTQREDLPQGFAIHETATISTVWPAMPCLNNLVLFDPLKAIESADTIIGELAEKWSWQDGYRNLVFFLRKDVKWHDGKPFTSKDVKHTFDLLREAPDATQKLRLNPRNDWYANVEAVEAADDHTIIFRLKRPQPSLLMMLASGYTPIYAAHVPAASYRTSCMGTGPFKLKEWRKGEFVEYVKNPDYFVKGRPYLDGLKYVIIGEPGTRIAALQTGQVDVSFPNEVTKTNAEQLKAAVPKLVITPYSVNVNDNIVMNIKKPPFDNVKVRLAVSHGIDRRALIQAVHQGGGVPGVSLAPKPYGAWGLLETDLPTLPGYGKPADEKAKARKLLADAGYSPQNPLRVEMVTRNISVYVDHGVVRHQRAEADRDRGLAQADRNGAMASAGHAGRLPDRGEPDGHRARRPGRELLRELRMRLSAELQCLLQRAGHGPVHQQSQELDPKKRLALVQAIQKKLEDEAARPILDWRLDYFTVWPHVKNFIPHQSMYNFGRLQEVWLDK